MCDEREQLIGYIYGEADPAERRQVEAHLADCHVCRAEVGGLRSVRDDLLAWDVPRHESVWRPFVPAPPVPVLGRVPAWAMVAAATLLFVVGAAGGMATRFRMPAAGSGTAVASVSSPAAPAGDAVPMQAASNVTPEDLATLEASILARVRSEMDDRIETVNATFGRAPGLARVVANSPSPEFQSFSERLAEVERWKDNQISLNAAFNDQFSRVNDRTRSLSAELERSGIRRVGYEPGLR